MSKDIPSTPHFPLSRETQLVQLGEQYNYLQGNIDAATTEGELDTYGVVEEAIVGRINQLTTEQHSPANAAVQNEVRVIDVGVEQTFGDVGSEISGIASARSISSKSIGATRVKDGEMAAVNAFSEHWQDKDGGVPVDAFEFTTENGARFRVVDMSGLFSSQAREPFTTSEQPEDYKREMLSALLQELVLYSANGYTQPLASVKIHPEIKYIARGSNRAYFKFVNSELPQAAEDAGEVTPDRTFAYIGSCQKNKQAELYLSLFGSRMKI